MTLFSKLFGGKPDKKHIVHAGPDPREAAGFNTFLLLSPRSSLFWGHAKPFRRNRDQSTSYRLTRF